MLRLCSSSRTRFAPLAWIFVLAIAASIPSPALAEGYQDQLPVSTEGGMAAESLIEDTQPGTPLSLAEAIALGLQNNLDVEVNRYAPYVSQMEKEGAWGAYDPLFDSDFGWRDNTPPAGAAIFDTEVEQFDGTAGISGLIPYVGARVGVEWTGNTQESPIFFSQLNPQNDSGLSLTASVPLMQGLLWSQEWTQIKTTKLGYQTSLENFETQIMDTVQSIIGSYWDLVATKEQQRVAEKSLESNEALLDQTKTQYQVGVVSKVEVVQAEAGVANSEFNLIVAQNNYQNAQDALIAAVLGDRIRAETILRFDPTDNPEYQAVDSVDVKRAVETAFAKRPEVTSAELGIEQTDVQLRFAKNARLPRLDLQASYRTYGYSGDCTPSQQQPVCPDIGNRFTDTFDPYFDSSDTSIRGVFTIPIGNIRGRKEVVRARLENRRARSELTRLKQSIIVRVRSAARGLVASAKGVEAAERRRLAAAEQLRAEKIRLEHGESTPFDVLQRERDLVEAESQKITALQAFRNSQVELERQQGTILESRNIMIDQVRELR